MSSKPTKVNNTEIIQYTTNNELKRNKHNYKLTEQDQKDIVLNYLFNKGNVHSLLDKYNISIQAYYDVIKKHKKNDFKIIDKAIAETRKNFNKRTTLIINKALDRIAEQLEEDENIDINKLSTTLGILYDKESLELGKSTSNSAFNINIKIDK